MARTPRTPEQSNIDDLLKQIKKLAGSNAKTDAKPVKNPNVSKAVTLFRKAQNSIEEAIALLEGGETPAQREVDPEAPFGRKKDGTPRKPAGRKAKADGPGTDTGTFTAGDGPVTGAGTAPALLADGPGSGVGTAPAKKNAKKA